MNSETKYQLCDTPERQAALDALMQKFNLWQVLIIDEEIKNMENAYITDTFIFTKERLTTRSLPKEEWSWNKSQQSVKVVVTNERITVTFYKLNNRKQANSNEIPPPCKVWIYKVKLHETGEKFFCFWCERGVDQVIPREPVTILDLAFLREFMSAEVAQLYWP